MGADVNCKPGDLAIRVSGPGNAYIPIGSIVRCISYRPGKAISKHLDGSSRIIKNRWHVERNGKQSSHLGLDLTIPDSELRPILNPGEDAQDETLSWVPVPSREEETA